MIMMMLMVITMILLCILIGLVLVLVVVSIGVIFHSGVGIFFYYSPLVIIFVVRSIDGVGRVGGWKVVDDASTSGCSIVII